MHKITQKGLACIERLMEKSKELLFMINMMKWKHLIEVPFFGKEIE